MTAATIETLRLLPSGRKSNAQMTALMVVANQYGMNPDERDLCLSWCEQQDCARCWRGRSWARIISDNPQFDGMDSRSR